MAASLLITAFFFGLPVLQFQTCQPGRGSPDLRIQYEKRVYWKYLLTNEYVTETIREVQELFEDPENVGYDGNEQFLIEDAYWNGIAPRESLLDLIAGNYADPNVSAGYSALPDLDT